MTSDVANNATEQTPAVAISNLSSPVLVELSSLAVVEIVGDDAQEFFQAQVCNDLKSMAANEMQINGYCNPKGRLLALFTVFAQDDGYRVILPADVAPAFAKRLQMFVLRAKVSVQIRDDLVCSGIVTNAITDGSSTEHEQLMGIGDLPELPDAQMRISDSGSVQLLRWHDSESSTPEQSLQARYLCIGTPSQLSSLWEDKRFTHTGWHYWRWLDINAGVPNVFAASVEQFIPQMLNMQHINALSFKKGCYPGQEIVARMQYLGKLKKHMKHVRLPGETKAPSPGDVLASDANNNAGQVVDAVVDEQGVNILAVVNIETPVADIKLHEQSLHEAPLPYALNAPSADSADSIDNSDS